MRFGAWNVRSLYRSGSIRTVAIEVTRYKLDIVGVQEVRWDTGGNVRKRGNVPPVSIKCGEFLD
jgi:exonuclease III